jgi:outer membrane protein assembly factor BamB
MIDLVAEYGTKEPLWYAGQCPLIVDNKAIIAPAGKDILMMAVDCETGGVVWETPNPDKWQMTHCSIIPMRFADKDFYVYPGSRGVAGMSAEDGTLLWKTDAWFLRVNVPTPIDCGDGMIFLCAGYKKGSMMLQLEQTDGRIDPKVMFELKADVFGSDQQTPIFYKGHIYGVRPDKQLVCMDTDGTIIWTSPTE